MVRFKNRYIVVEIINPSKPREEMLFKNSSLHSSVLRQVQQLHGDFGLAAIKAGFMTKYCNSITRIALIKVRHGPHRIVSSALPFVDRLEGKSIFLNTIYMGATMRQCFKFIRTFQQKRLAEVWATLKTDEERKAYEKAIMELGITEESDVVVK